MGSLYQGWRTLPMKAVSLISNVNLSWHTLRPFPLVPSLFIYVLSYSNSNLTVHMATCVSVVTFSSGYRPSNGFYYYSDKTHVWILQKMNDLFFSSKGSSTVTRVMTGKITIPSKDLTDSAGTQDLSVMLLTNITENSYNPGKNGIRRLRQFFR